MVMVSSIVSSFLPPPGRLSDSQFKQVLKVIRVDVQSLNVWLFDLEHVDILGKLCPKSQGNIDIDCDVKSFWWNFTLPL